MSAGSMTVAPAFRSTAMASFITAFRALSKPPEMPRIPAVETAS
jgi:hypothetical protein